MWLWRSITPTSLLLASMILFAVAIYLGFISTAEHDNKIIASALAVTAGVLINAAVKFHSEMRDRAFTKIEKSSNDEEFFAAMRRCRDVNKALKDIDLKHAVFAAAVYTDIVSQDDIGKVNAVISKTGVSPSQIVSDIFLISNFFEEIYIAIKHNEVNSRLIYDFYSGMFCRFYIFAKDFLPVFRNVPLLRGHKHGQSQLPEVFTGLDRLFDLWSGAYIREYRHIIQCNKKYFAKFCKISNGVKRCRKCIWAGQ